MATSSTPQNENDEAREACAADPATAAAFAAFDAMTPEERDEHFLLMTAEAHATAYLEAEAATARRAQRYSRN